MDDLLHQARSGDGDAFAQLFQEHAPMLWKVAASVMDDEDEAADMLQETAIKAWRAIPRFDGKSALSTWLTRILLNRCFDEIRSKRRTIPFSDITQAVDAGEARLLVQGSAPAGVADACERMDMDATLARLGVSDRLILTLFYVNDLPISEIASVLDASEGAVRTRLARARKRFKGIYERSARVEVSASGMAVAEATI